MALETYSTGTVAVTQGSQMVTLSGGTWAEAWAVPGNQVAIAGEAQSNFVLEWTDTTHVKLALPVARTTASGLTYSMLITAPAFGTNRLAALTNIERIRLMSETAGLNSLLAVPSAGLVTPALDDRLAGWDESNSDAIVPFLVETLLRAGTRNAAKTATYTVQTAAPNSDFGRLISMSASGGARTVNLPAAATAGDGFVVGVKKTDSSANAVTIDGSGSETIDGAATYVVSAQNQTVWLRCDGTGWSVVAEGGASAYGRSLSVAADASAALSLLGASSFFKTLFDDASAAAVLTTLGVSGFMQTALSASSGGNLLNKAGLAFELGNIADDAVVTLDYYTGLSGARFIFGMNLGSVMADFVARTHTSANGCAGSGIGRTFAFTGGALTGTTGADGSITFGARNDGKVDIENRAGSTANNCWMIVLR